MCLQIPNNTTTAVQNFGKTIKDHQPQVDSDRVALINIAFYTLSKDKSNKSMAGLATTYDIYRVY